jgi:hypothetical protein
MATAAEPGRLIDSLHIARLDWEGSRLANVISGIVPTLNLNRSFPLLLDMIKPVIWCGRSCCYLSDRYFGQRSRFWRVDVTSKNIFHGIPTLLSGCYRRSFFLLLSVVYEIPLFLSGNFFLFNMVSQQAKFTQRLYPSEIRK